jgi:hypothetical protein
MYLFDEPKVYEALYTVNPPVIDGNLEDVWEQAAWTESFQDIEGKYTNKAAPYYETKAKMLWNDSCLYIAAILIDKHIWASLDQRDQVVYFDNDFEIFIDPQNSANEYFEIEINALNTIFDLFMGSPYRTNGPMLIDWNCKHLQSAVKILGTLNKVDDLDSAWLVEMAIPFADLLRYPQAGDFFRINFSRVEWDTEIVDNKYIKKTDKKTGKNLPENNWVWSPQGVINMHCPETWGYLFFKNKEKTHFMLPDEEYWKRWLWLLFHKQARYYNSHGTYAFSLPELNMTEKISSPKNERASLTLIADSSSYQAQLRYKNNIMLISEKGKIYYEK